MINFAAKIFIATFFFFQLHTAYCFEIGTVVRGPEQNQYQIARKLGDGGESEVYLVSLVEGDRLSFALKLLRESYQDAESADKWRSSDARGYRLMQNLITDDSKSGRFGKILSHGVVTDGVNFRYGYLMPVFDGVWLKDMRDDLVLVSKRSAITLNQAVERGFSIMVEVVRGLIELGQVNLAHLDIKPGNLGVFLDDLGQEKVQILDYGSVQSYGKLKGGRITPSYTAPEIVFGGVTALADYYSLGAMMFYLLSGEQVERTKPDLAQKSDRFFDAMTQSSQLTVDSKKKLAVMQVVVSAALNRDLVARRDGLNQAFSELDQLLADPLNIHFSPIEPFALSAAPLDCVRAFGYVLGQ